MNVEFDIKGLQCLLAGILIKNTKKIENNTPLSLGKDASNLKI